MISTNTLTLGKYHYWDEVEDDNIKRFHSMDGSDGSEHSIDFSPYHKPTDAELEAVREIVRITGIIPTRSWNLNNNFHGYQFNTDDPLLQGEPDTIRILNEIKEDYGE